MHMLSTTQSLFSWTNVRLKYDELQFSVFQFLALSPLHYTMIFIEYCGNDSSACVVDCCTGMTRPKVVFYARSPFLENIYAIVEQYFCPVFDFCKPLWTKCEWWEPYCHAKFWSWTYAHCLDLMWAEKFFALSSHTSDIPRYQRNNHKNYHILFVTVQTTHCWPTKSDFNLYFFRCVHSPGTTTLI